jgi:hypothetical protein
MPMPDSFHLTKSAAAVFGKANDGLAGPAEGQTSIEGRASRQVVRRQPGAGDEDTDSSSFVPTPRRGRRQRGVARLTF